MEFVPDEFVEYDADEFIPDEFVIDDVEHVQLGQHLPPDSGVVFAGPSDAPPALTRPGGESTRRTRARPRWPVATAACLIGVVAIGRVVFPEEPRATTEEATPAPATAPAPAAPEEAAAPSASAAAVAASASAEPPGVSPLAMDTKEASQSALEHGKVALAIDLGERAVALDPTDAESWLILGGAYLQRGAGKEARRCFQSCADVATHGGQRECRALLR